MKKAHMFLVLLVIAVFVISTAFAENSLNGKSADGKLKKEKDIKISDNKIIEKEGKGKINFKNSFDVEIENVDNNPNVYIANNLIAINTEELPELNQPATITFYNLTFENAPAIYYSEGFTANLSKLIPKLCPEDICSNINYDKETGNLSFDVSGFSIYYYAPRLWDKASPFDGYCSNDADCKPTAYCAEITDCFAQFRDLTTDPITVKNWKCYHSPAAGIESSSCSNLNNYYQPNGICKQGYERYDWISHYGYGWYSYFCSNLSSCATCKGTNACNIDSCWQSCAKNCFEDSCFSNKKDNGCINLCRDNCIKGCGGITGYGNNENPWLYNGIFKYFCQPKVCDADDLEVGLCHYEGDSYNSEQNVGIGTKICADKKQWQVCVEGDGDPCGEWEILEDDETKVTTTDMYGLDTFTVDVCAGNSAPAININMVSQYANVCNDLTCEAEISDDCSGSFEVEYKVTGGHGSLAGTMPEITGTTTCSGNPCKVTVPIPKQYTTCDDVIKCEIKAKDVCGASTIKSADTNSINGVDACGK